MKPLHLLPPVAALAVAGTWLGTRQHSITALEKDTVLLRQHIDAARHDAAADDLSFAAARANGTKDPDALDWKELAGTMAQAERGGMPDMRAMLKIQSKLMALSGEELTAALDEIAALDLDKQARQSLENILVGLLAQKDPQLALDRYLDRMNDNQGMSSWQLANAFQQWAGKDRAAALAWFDAQVAAGKFESRSLDGKSDSRLRFEAAAVASLIADDPAAAGRRIAALPQDQRRDLFQQGMLANLKPGSEKAFADLVREHVPEGERGQALASSAAHMMHQGGYERVGQFLDDIDAAPDERAEVAKQSAQNKIRQLAREGGIDRGAIDEMREWVAAQSPDRVDAITGESLADLWGNRSEWSDRAKLVGELHAENSSDDLLVSFLGGHQATQHREAALEMAAKIADETKRAEIVARLEGKPVRSTVIAE